MKEYVATDPVAPVLPQAPQVSQFVESSTLSITVLLAVLGVGVGEGVGVGVGEGLGVGDGVGLGAGVGAGDAAGVGDGVGDGLAASVGAVELFATMLPPQPVMVMVKALDAKTKTSKATSERLQRKKSPQEIGLEEAAWENSSGRMMLLDYAGNLRLSSFSPEIRQLKLGVRAAWSEVANQR